MIFSHTANLKKRSLELYGINNLPALPTIIPRTAKADAKSRKMDITLPLQLQKNKELAKLK